MRARILFALGLSGLGLGACSALVSSELETIPCRFEGTIGPPACPVGASCRGGMCAPCQAQEVCDNGLDDNCDNRLDENCALGGTGGVAGAFGGGGAPVGGNGGVAGGTGAVGGGGGTGGIPDGELGSTCTAVGQCNPGLFCADPSQHGGNTTGGFVCTKSCCNSTECNPWADGVCYGAKGGYALCLPASRVGRPTPGSLDVGTTCGLDAECRSAVCDGTLCQDTCCAIANCPGNLGSCSFQAMKGSNWQTFTCSTKGGSDYGVLCGGDGNCNSDTCLNSDPLPICSKPCCRSSECSGLLPTCWYTKYPSGDVAKACSYTGVSPGSAANGAPCSVAGDCASTLCVTPEQGPSYCSDACCKNSDCGNPGLFSCLPAKTTAGDTLLICVPN